MLLFFGIYRMNLAIILRFTVIKYKSLYRRTTKIQQNNIKMSTNTKLFYVEHRVTNKQGWDAFVNDNYFKIMAAEDMTIDKGNLHILCTSSSFAYSKLIISNAHAHHRSRASISGGKLGYTFMLRYDWHLYRVCMASTKSHVEAGISRVHRPVLSRRSYQYCLLCSEYPR